MSSQVVRKFPRPDDQDAGVRAGREALARLRWREAREHFEAALGREETPEALEGLATSVRGSGGILDTFPLLERAFALYHGRGDRRAAARLAMLLGLSYAGYQGEYAVANGWLGRSHRLLEGLEPGPEQAWLALWEAHLAFLYRDDLEGALELHVRGKALARDHEDANLEMLAVALDGLILIAQGRVEDGMRRLDEAAAAAVSGGISDVETWGQACCYMMRACEQVQDFDRAAQWVERTKEYCQRLEMPLSLSFCRSHYAAILTWRGVWEEAEAELAAHAREMAKPVPVKLPENFARTGELRRRQGRFAEAADLFARGEASPIAALGRALLALDQRDPAGAVDLAHRYLRRLPPGDKIAPMPAYSLLVRAHCALGERDLAGAALAELKAIAAATPTAAFAAAVAEAEGTVAACAGDHEEACRRFADAVFGYERAAAPMETGGARLGLAAALLALGRRAGAEHEAKTALAAFERIGAAAEAARSRALLDRICPPEGAAESGDGTATESACAGLSARQREVLRLVSQGLSNKEIGARLYLSEFTVKRHVADILTKLDLPSRAAAAAWAVQRGVA